MGFWMIYLDNSATTRTLPEAAQASMQAMTEDFYNPAAAYAYGARTEKRVNEARAVVARPLRAKRDEIIFTSGGTESNNAAVFGSLRGWHGPKRVITTAVEHPSIFEAVQSLKQSGDVDIVILPVNEQPVMTGSAVHSFFTTATRPPNVASTSTPLPPNRMLLTWQSMMVVCSLPSMIEAMPAANLWLL